jgi:hypothetical protein
MRDSRMFRKQDFRNTVSMRLLGAVLSAGAGLFSVPAWSLDLTAPFLIENPNVLPPKVRNPRYVNLFMSVDSKFDAAGVAQPLGLRLNKLVRWNDVLNSMDDPKKRTMARAKLTEAGLDVNGSPGWTTGNVNTFVDVKVPVLAVGITDRFTLGIAVPVMNVDVSADTGFIKADSGEAERLVEAISKSSVTEGNNAARKMNNSVNEKLTNYGYEPIQSQNFTRVGDIQVVGKYLVHQDAENILSWKSSLVLPTGTPLNVNRALDIPTGDGRYQIGSSLIYGRTLPYGFHDFRWTAYGGVLAMLPHSLERRIPVSADDPISRDKEMLIRDFGANLNVGTSVNYTHPATGIVTAAGYQVNYLTPTRYSGGTRYSADRYSYLEGLTPSQTLHSATLMAGFSTVEWYQAKKFVYPFQANFVYSHPIAGRNVSTTDVMSGELVLFF